MGRTLAERLQNHAQRKAKLAETGVRLKEDERRVRTRRLIQAGGLVDKAGLLALDTNALYGALLGIARDAGREGVIEGWLALGGRAFAREARLEEEGKEPIVVRFQGAVSRSVGAAMRGAGFRFNALLRHWEGRVDPGKAEELAATHGGTVSRLSMND